MSQTTLTSTRIAIIGGGLSGLLAARALHRHCIHDFVLLEARQTGRAHLLSWY